jgi:hypothetical protein
VTSAVELAGQRAAAEALRMWDLDVFDPPKGSKHPRAAECLKVIEDVIDRAGWGFATPYLGNGAPQWCGLFAGDCWRAAGLDPSWLATYFASTYRLGLWANYKRFAAKSKPNPPPADPADPADRRRFAELRAGAAPAFEPRPGDIVIVGDGEPDAGDHVTVCIAYDAGRRVFDTISGNGGGLGPHGDKREGISRRNYSIDAGGYRAMFVIRPAFGDLLAEHVLG